MIVVFVVIPERSRKMERTVKHFSVNYDPVNENNTFTNGNILEGRVVLEVTKDLKVDQLYVKCKGEANVSWTESNTDDTDDSYSAHERYFKLKQIFIRDTSKKEKNDGAILTPGELYNKLVKPGSHVFPFRFQLPQGNLPSSFKGLHGSITYGLEARLCRAWKRTRTAKTEFTFVSKVYEAGPHLMKPLLGTTEKKMKLFTTGSASVKAATDKSGYIQGEIITVESDIENSSSRDLKLKYKLEEKQTFTAQSRQNHTGKVLFKVVTEPIPSRSKKTMIDKLKIPTDVSVTIANCAIISVEYMLKVYLDVPYARDPEILFPVVILPADQHVIQQQTQADFSTNKETLKPEWSSSPSQHALAPGPDAAIGFTPQLYPSLYTPQPANPQGPPPSYADIFAASTPPASVLHPSPLTSALSPPLCPAPDYLTSPPAYHHPALECSSAVGMSQCQGPLNSEFYPTTTS